MYVRYPRDIYLVQSRDYFGVQIQVLSVFQYNKPDQFHAIIPCIKNPDPKVVRRLW